MDKVKVSKEVKEAIEYVTKESPAYKGRRDEILIAHCNVKQSDGKDSWIRECKPLNSLSFDELARALYIGYEVEQTPEDKVREYYNEQASIPYNDQDPSYFAIRKVLTMLDRVIEGVNA